MFASDDSLVEWLRSDGGSGLDATRPALVASVVPSAFVAHTRLPLDLDFSLLTNLLSSATSAATSSYACWDGMGIGTDTLWASQKKFDIGGLACVIFLGPVPEVPVLATLAGDPGLNATSEARISLATIERTGALRLPTLWWPADRSWVLGWDVDTEVFYVASDAELAGALRHEFPDALPVRPGDRIELLQG